MSLAPLLNAAPAIPLHAFAAMAAFALGVVQLAAPKGTLPHRTLGWIWVLLMAFVAASAFWIHQIRLWGPWSPIHLLSIFTGVTGGGLVAACWLAPVAAIVYLVAARPPAAAGAAAVVAAAGLLLAAPWLARLVMGGGLDMMTGARGASNAKAKSELGWTLRYPSWREGFAAVYKG